MLGNLANNFLLSYDTFFMTLVFAMFSPLCLFNYNANFVKNMFKTGHWAFFSLFYSFILIFCDNIASAIGIRYSLLIPGFDVTYYCMFCVFIGYYFTTSVFSKNFNRVKFNKYSKIMLAVAPFFCCLDNLFSSIKFDETSYYIDYYISIGSVFICYLFWWFILKLLNVTPNADTSYISTVIKT